MRTPLVKGRFFDSRDNLNSPKVVMVNQILAQKVFPNQDPIGKRIDVGWGDPGWSEIIGVVADAKQDALTAEHRSSTLMLYAQNVALMQYLDTNLVVRTSQDPLSAVGAIRSQIQQLDPNQPLADVKTMDVCLQNRLLRSALLHGSSAASARLRCSWRRSAFTVCSRTSWCSAARRLVCAWH